MTPLSDILSQRRLDNDLVTFHATEDWGQGRTCFGGFLSVLALVAMRDALALDAPLRALQTNFIGPVAPGEVVCRTRLLRQGKNVTQAQCEIWSEDTLCGLVVGIFGFGRATQLPSHRAAQKIQPAKSEGDSSLLPFIPKITPQFLQHVQMKWADGSFPYSGQGSWKSSVYLKTVDTRLSPEIQVILLADGPPTPALSFFSGPTMASSVSWSLEMQPIAQEWDASEPWFQIDMEAVAASEGYSNLVSHLWTPKGELASLGYQVVAVFG